MIYKSERAHFIKGNEYLMQQSAARYRFAEEYCKNKKVLDTGSGEGYGIDIISKFSALSIGVDYDFETVKHSRDKYKSKNSYFVCADCNNLPFKDSFFDAVISFELIEHLEAPDTYLTEITRIITKDGIYIGSTPQIPPGTLDRNPFHKHPYDKEAYKDLLLQHFETVAVLGERDVRKISMPHAFLRGLDIFNLRNKLRVQVLRKFFARMLGSTPFEEVKLKDFAIDKEHIEDACILVSMSRKPKKQKKAE